MNDSSLNSGQQKAVDIFYGFLLSETENTMLLQGRAGTGKSYVTRYLLDVVIPKYQANPNKTFPLSNVYLTATTNKAVEVLSKESGHPASTLASLLRLKVKNNLWTGKTVLEPNSFRTDEDNIHNSLIIVDESSMLSQDILGYLFKYTSNCKFLFIGDKYQINPVNEGVSIIYECEATTAELTQIVRTESEAIKELCEQLRDTVKGGSFKPIKTVPNVIEKLSVEQMRQKLFDVFSDRSASARVLAYTNKAVLGYNKLIRKDIRKLPDEFVAKDTVVVSNSCKLPCGNRVSVEQQLYVVGEGSSKTLYLEDEENQRNIAFPYKTLLCISPRDIEAYELGHKVTVMTAPVTYDQELFSNLLKHFSSTKQWKSFYQLKDTFPNLRPVEATTYHKGQGSTYDIIFLDLESLASCRRDDEIARMLYVGVSRPKKHIYLFGSLPEKYGGII